MRLALGRGLSLVVTDGEAGLPDHDAQLFLMSDDHGDPLAESKVMASEKLATMLGASLKGGAK